VWHKNYEAMQFLIDRGIDMTIRDYRWEASAVGWAAVRCERREDGAMDARGATTAGAGIALKGPGDQWLADLQLITG